MIGKLKEQVEKVLIESPETRNSDITLTIEIWKRFYPDRISKSYPKDESRNIGVGMVDCVDLRDLYDLPREDNIKRIRAKFCERGFKWAFPTDWKIAKGRGIQEDRWREALGYPLLEQVKYPTRQPSYTEPLVNVHRVSTKIKEEKAEEKTTKLF